MMKRMCIGTALFLGLFFCDNQEGQAQTYEIYDQNFNLTSRLEYDLISVLGESVRVSAQGGEVRLLNKEYKPFVSLKSPKVYAYDQPWIVVEGTKGKGVFHEYGDEIFPAEYDHIQTFYTQILAQKGNQYWIYDHATRKVKDLGRFDHATLVLNGQVIAKSPQGYFLPLSKNPDYLYADLRPVNDKFILSKEPSGFGLINREGDYVLDPIIDQMVYLDGDYFYAFDGNQYMLIRGREEKVDIRYTSYHKITYENDVLLEYIHGKLRRVLKNDGILLDQVGMERVFSVGEKHFNVWTRESKLGLLGPNGWEVNPVVGVDAIFPGKEFLYGAKKGGLFGYMDRNGSWIIPAQFQEIRKFNDGLAAVMSSGAWGFVSRSGQMVFPAEFDHVSDFFRGLAIVRKQGKFHLVDKNGGFLLEKGYDKISLVPDNYFLIEEEGKMGLVAPDGNLLFEPKFDELRREQADRILVRIGDKYGVATESGDYLLPIYYQQILFDQANNRVLARDDYQFVQVPEKANLKKKKGA